MICGMADSCVLWQMNTKQKLFCRLFSCDNVLLYVLHCTDDGVPLCQVGLIPDNKLLDLLDMALAADTVNTVKGMRDLLESGVDALSLVAQLASLITNIIVGTFELCREARKKGFFRRNLRKLPRIFTNSSILHVFEYDIRIKLLQCT